MILLMILCVSISKITAQNDSLTISPKQVKNIYIGLKQNEALKTNLNDCIQVSNSLNDIIIKQNNTVQNGLFEISELNIRLENVNSDYKKQSEQLLKLKNRKIPFYKHPILFFILGGISGVFISK